MGGIVYATATLSRIAQAGGGDAYDADPADGPDRWTGSLGVTFRDRHVTQIAGGRLDQVDAAHMIVPYAVNGTPVGALVQQGDTLVFIFEGTTHTRKAGTIVRAQMTGRVRVDLEDS